MRHLVICMIAIMSFLPSNMDENFATCRGSSPCNACKNCRYCKHCSKNGGTCGVCSRNEIKPIVSEETVCRDTYKHQ